jgi:DNA polymerase (family X)
LDQKKITKQLKLIIKLMELHDENPFKIRGYQSVVNMLDRGDVSIEGLDLEGLQAVNGIGKSIAEVIHSLGQSQTHPYLETLLAKTPTGIVEVLEIKGLGPKKVKVLWEELNITSIHELLEACQSGQVAKTKGFGEKTQESILAALAFREVNQGKWLYAEAEALAQLMAQQLTSLDGVQALVPVGEFARKMEIIEQVEWLICTEDLDSVLNQLAHKQEFEQNFKISSPFKWRGCWGSAAVKVIIHFTTPQQLVKDKIIKTGNKAHLGYILEGEKTLMESISTAGPFADEEEAYLHAGIKWIPEEMREGTFEFGWIKTHQVEDLVTDKDLKGILHNHSTYSDGRHTLKQMAEYCRDLGYQYLGMSDHSRSAFYAAGLDVDRVAKQQAEIDELNKALAPFKIYKGIESDILVDGSLDYPDDVLASFDFVVASVHSVLNMDKNKATTRLIKAIANPYTTILGHPTGRLLLRREGYPLDHKAIIDACAAYGVVIEINANPWRLDLDWRWIQYALEKGVKLSVNPDAHQLEGYADMRYGVIAGRKGGLTRDMTFNALTLPEMDAYLQQRKPKIK